MQYDLDYRLTRLGYVAGEPINVPLLQAWLESGGITVTSIDVDVIDLWIAHVDASDEPDLTDSWPLFWNNISWQVGDPLPTPPNLDDGEPPNEAPPTTTYTLDLADTALGWISGSDIRADQISQYLIDKGAPAQSVSLVRDGTGALTGQIDVVRLTSGTTISPADWALYNGPASVTIYGPTSIGEPPLNTADDQSPQQGTRIGDGASAGGKASTAVGKDANAPGDYSTAVGDTTEASGFAAAAVGRGASASGGSSTAVGTGASASANVSTAVGAVASASGGASLAVGAGSSAKSDLSSAIGDGAAVDTGSDRSFALGAFAAVPANNKDLGVILVNTVEIKPSRPGGTNDPTVLKLHASDGTVHTIGFSPGTGILTVDGLPVLTSIGTGYITSTMILDGTIALADLSAAVIANFATASALTTESTNRSNADISEVTNRNAAIATHAALTATHGVTGALVGTSDTQTLANKTLTAPIIADFTAAPHTHANAAGGGNIPESSVTNLVTDLAAKASTASVTSEASARAAADLLLVPKTAIPSGQYYSNSNNGCYGAITTLALSANVGYFMPIELDYSSGSLTNISFSVTAMGTALNVKWAIYARSASGNATGTVLASGTIALTGVGLQVGTIVPTIAMGAGLPNEYNLAIVPDGTVTVTALSVVNGGRNMYRSGNLLTNVTAGRTTGVTYSTGFASPPSYTYTDQQIVPLAGLKAA